MAQRAGVSFELEGLELEGDELVVIGHWSGVRGLRFVRPMLVADDRRILATLEHKPWAPSLDRAWVAAFPWDGSEVDVDALTLAVAPQVTVALGDASATTLLHDAPRPEPAPQSARRPEPAPQSEPETQSEPRPEPAPSEPAPQSARRPEPAPQSEPAPQVELSPEPEPQLELAPVTPIHGSERSRPEPEPEPEPERPVAAAVSAQAPPVGPGAALEPELDAIWRERDEAVVGRERALAERDEALRGRERALAERDEALHGRERALAQRDAAIAQRHEALLAYRALLRQAQAEGAHDARPREDAPDGATDPEPPFGIGRAMPAARTLMAQLQRPADSASNLPLSVFDLWVIRVLGTVAAGCFVLLLISLLRVLV